LLAVLEPKNTMRSVPSQSVYEQVVAPWPSVLLIATVEAAWHRRAELSTWLVPIARAAFCAA
jgi:hypothetical protein